MNIKNNQRFRDSEIRMEAAMLELMKRMDFKKITVKKICETAKVNRTTFYAHFIDIYDMLNKMESHLRKELLESYAETDLTMFSNDSIILFFQHIKNHQYFYRIALQTRKEFPLNQGFEPMWNQIIKPQCLQAGITSENEMMYHFAYFQAGFTMLLKKWVDTGCKESEMELAKIIQKSFPDFLKSKK